MQTPQFIKRAVAQYGTMVVAIFGVGFVLGVFLSLGTV